MLTNTFKIYKYIKRNNKIQNKIHIGFKDATDGMFNGVPSFIISDYFKYINIMKVKYASIIKTEEGLKRVIDLIIKYEEEISKNRGLLKRVLQNCVPFFGFKWLTSSITKNFCNTIECNTLKELIIENYNIYGKDVNEFIKEKSIKF